MKHDVGVPKFNMKRSTNFTVLFTFIWPCSSFKKTKQITKKKISCLRESFTNYFWAYLEKEDKGPTGRAHLLTTFFYIYLLWVQLMTWKIVCPQLILVPLSQFHILNHYLHHSTDYFHLRNAQNNCQIKIHPTRCASVASLVENPHVPRSSKIHVTFHTFK